MGRLAAFAAALMVSAAASLLAAVPASAHASLVSSDPRDGAELVAPPATVSLTFSESLMPDFVAFSVLDASLAPVPVAGLAINGATATFDWPSTAPAGRYTVGFRVVSSDGHPIEGEVAFSYTTSAPTSGSATPSPSPTTTSASPTPTSATPEPSPTDATPTPAPSPTTTPVDPASSTSSIGWLIATAAIVGAAVVAIAVILSRRRR